jgi:hypothetical protein
MLTEHKIVIPKFPSHVIKRHRKTMPPLYEKINYNKLYSGNLFHMDRNTMVSEMHKFLDQYIPYNLKMKLPVKVDVTLVCPINWGKVQMHKTSNTVSWKPPAANYNPDWDAFNAVDVWRKVIEDTLTAHNIYPDDNVRYLRGGGGYVEFCNTFDEREMIIEIKSI